MEYKYMPRGVCSTEMIFDIDENTNVVRDLKVIRGCSRKSTRNSITC